MYIFIANDLGHICIRAAEIVGDGYRCITQLFEQLLMISIIHASPPRNLFKFEVTITSFWIYYQQRFLWFLIRDL